MDDNTYRYCWCPCPCPVSVLVQVPVRFKRILRFCNVPSPPSFLKLKTMMSSSSGDPAATEHAETHGFAWTTEEVIKKHVASLSRARSDGGGRGGGNTNQHGSIVLAPNPAALHLMTTFYRFSDDDVYGSFRDQASSLSSSSSSSLSSSSSSSSSSRDVLADYHVLQSLQNETWCKDKVQEGVQVARDGRYELSIELCSNALGLYPDSVDGLVCRAASYANLSKFDLAIRDFQRALELNPAHENAKEYLGKVMAKWEQRSSLPSAVLPAEPADLRSSSNSSGGVGVGSGGRPVPVVPSKVRLSSEAVGALLPAAAGEGSSSARGGGGSGAKSLTINGYSFVADDDDDDDDAVRRRVSAGDGATATRIRKRAPSTASSASDDASDASTSPSDSGSSRSKKSKHAHKPKKSKHKHKKSKHKHRSKKHKKEKEKKG